METDVKIALSGTLFTCETYLKVVEAIKSVSKTGSDSDLAEHPCPPMGFGFSHWLKEFGVMTEEVGSKEWKGTNQAFLW